MRPQDLAIAVKDSSDSRRQPLTLSWSTSAKLAQTLDNAAHPSHRIALFGDHLHGLVAHIHTSGDVETLEVLARFRHRPYNAIIAHCDPREVQSDKIGHFLEYRTQRSCGDFVILTQCHPFYAGTRFPRFEDMIVDRPVRNSG